MMLHTSCPSEMSYKLGKVALKLTLREWHPQTVDVNIRFLRRQNDHCASLAVNIEYCALKLWKFIVNNHYIFCTNINEYFPSQWGTFSSVSLSWLHYIDLNDASPLAQTRGRLAWLWCQRCRWQRIQLFNESHGSIRCSAEVRMFT